MATEFKLPELGENIETADVVNVLVNPDDIIQAEQSVLELETEKAVLELPCPVAGRVESIRVKAGDRIKVGQVVMTIDQTAAAPAPAKPPEKPTEEAPKPPERPAEAPKAPAEEPPPKAAARPVSPPTPERAEPPAPAPPVAERPAEERPPAPASPAIRRLAREMGIDLSQVKGTGPAGRITEEDLHGHVRRLAAGAPGGLGVAVPAPELPDFTQWGPIERKPISAVRRKTAQVMSLAWQIVPQVTQYDLADITELEAIRKRYVQARGEAAPKITITAILLKAVVAALKEFPQFNASFDPAAGELIYKKYYHIGVAVDTPAGLLVPVIRDVDSKSIVRMAVELDDLASRARQRKLDLAQLRGSTFTVTNLGGIGGTAFSPIVYWPEVAILGVARARQEQVIREGGAQTRLMLPLCLSYDHRVIDGADGARFVRRLAGLLTDPLELLIGG